MLERVQDKKGERVEGAVGWEGVLMNKRAEGWWWGGYFPNALAIDLTVSNDGARSASREAFLLSLVGLVGRSGRSLCRCRLGTAWCWGWIEGLVLCLHVVVR